MFKRKKKNGNTSSNYFKTPTKEPKENELQLPASSKKSKNKTIFQTLKRKLSLAIDNRCKDAVACNGTIKLYGSKSVEILTNSFEEVSVSDRVSVENADLNIERNNWALQPFQQLNGNTETISSNDYSPQPQTNNQSWFQPSNHHQISYAFNENNNLTNINCVVQNIGTTPIAEESEGIASPSKDTGKCEPVSCRKKPLICQRKGNKDSKDTYNNEETSRILPNQPNRTQKQEISKVNLRDLGLACPSYIGMQEGESRSLTKEIRELSKYGWYWGPVNRNEAEEKLNDQPDGAFLVRDSSDTKYLLSLSFRSYGKTLHTRIEHSNGWFSFYPEPDHDSHRSLVGLINNCILESDGGVFCYSRPSLKGSPSFPVRLTKPVSRFMQVRSLQYLCRFVIRQYTSINHIQTLPLPTKIKGYLEESYY